MCNSVIFLYLKLRCTYGLFLLLLFLFFFFTAVSYKQLSFGTKPLFLVPGCSIKTEINKTNLAVKYCVRVGLCNGFH